MPTLLEKPRNDNGKVTAGLPSLSSEKRYQITEFGLNQVYQKALQAEYCRNEQTALQSDGAIEDTTDWEQVVGMPLTGARIMARLKRLNSQLWFERANADSNKTGVYVLRPDLKGGMEKVFLCGMETEINPEYSVRVVDNEGKAKGIISGWRRVLGRLIEAKLITEPRAYALFGPPSRDSQNWARYTQ